MNPPTLMATARICRNRKSELGADRHRDAIDLESQRIFGGQNRLGRRHESRQQGDSSLLAPNPVASLAQFERLLEALWWHCAIMQALAVDCNGKLD
jgi:hypothetical protein